MDKRIVIVFIGIGVAVAAVLFMFHSGAAPDYYLVNENGNGRVDSAESVKPQLKQRGEGAPRILLIPSALDPNIPIDFPFEWQPGSEPKVGQGVVLKLGDFYPESTRFGYWQLAVIFDGDERGGFTSLVRMADARVMDAYVESGTHWVFVGVLSITGESPTRAILSLPGDEAERARGSWDLVRWVREKYQ